MFRKRCDQVKLSEENRLEPFLIILAESTKVFYYDELHRRNSSLDELATCVKSRFETLEKSKALAQEWKSLPFQAGILTNTAKTLIECLELMISRLSDTR